MEIINESLKKLSLTVYSNDAKRNCEIIGEIITHSKAISNPSAPTQVIDIDLDFNKVVKNTLGHKFTDQKDGTFTFETEDRVTALVACAHLNLYQMPYKITELDIDYTFSDMVEDIFELYMSESYDMTLNEELFLRNYSLINANTNSLFFKLRENDLEKHLTAEDLIKTNYLSISIFNDHFDALLKGNYCLFEKKEEILKMHLNKKPEHNVLYSLNFYIDLLKTIDFQGLNEYA